ncbi:UPAR/Ly6 domain-containing protein crok [Prorops nasuta]|uniref:UPAR/Ly6 domain-containing protein crok n=1 Tax=Prorops nasuta TaxID=863751 RepID=UPI0034CD167E
MLPNPLKSTASILVLLCVLITTFQHGYAIICYKCNSEYDPRCGDPFDPYSLGTVNCSFQPRLDHLSQYEPTICRKISQIVYGQTRVVRGCGYLTDEKDDGACQRRSGTHDVKVNYCSCNGDLCNSAGNCKSSVLLIGSFVVVNLIVLLHLLQTSA